MYRGRVGLVSCDLEELMYQFQEGLVLILFILFFAVVPFVKRDYSIFPIKPGCLRSMFLLSCLASTSVWC